MKSACLLLCALWTLAGPAFGLAAPDNGTTAREHRIETRTPEGLRKLFRPAESPLPFVSAHRGGARAGFPENCLATFEDTLRRTFAIMEVDPRHTKDGKIVLHHDPALDRTTTGRGRVADFTLAELERLHLKDPAGKITGFRIPTLDEALEWARGRTVLVLDQKDVPATERVNKITALKAEAHAIVIVYNFADARACHALNPDVMLEVMIPDLPKAREFDALGIPWDHVVAFLGHTPPADPELPAFIHRRGASCMVGTSRNLDQRVTSREVAEIRELKADYQAILRRGNDLIETDIPTLLGPLLRESAAISNNIKQDFLKLPAGAGPAPAKQPAVPKPAPPPAAEVTLVPDLLAWGLPPRSQGDRGTCSVFALVGAMEYALARGPRQGTRLSVEFLNWASNEAIGRLVDGGFFADLWQGYLAHGICPESALPYRPRFDAGLRPTPAALDQADTLRRSGLRLHWIKRWDIKTGLTDDQFGRIKRTLADRWPVCGGLRWPKRERWNDGVLAMCPPEEVFDGHSVLLTGFRDDPLQPGGGVFLVRDPRRRADGTALPYRYARDYMNDAAWVAPPADAARR